jgi:hypothetical protein
MVAKCSKLSVPMHLERWFAKNNVNSVFVSPNGGEKKMPKILCYIILD